MRILTSVFALLAIFSAGCASEQASVRVPPKLPAEAVRALDEYRVVLNHAAPLDPVRDLRDPALKARITEPVELRRTQPALTREARSQSREGRVVLAAVIERNGSVSNAKVLYSSGSSSFAAASLDALREWRYSPGMIDGAPVRVLLTVTTTYRNY